jgi:predicted Zn-dependent peptidase
VLFRSQLSCDPDKAPRVKSILRKEAAKLKRGITKQELQRVKNRTRTALVFAAETPFDRFRQLVQEWTARRELLTPEEMLARVEAVTLDDLNQLLDECPLDARCAVAELGPPVRRLMTKSQAPKRKQGPNRQTKKKHRRPK